MSKTLTKEMIATLKQAALAVSPQDIDSAERIENRPDGSYLTCPACEGEGCIPFESDYCNYDHIAIGVQFYGVGDGFGKAEAYFRAARPATILALLNRLEHAEAALLATQQPEPPTFEAKHISLKQNGSKLILTLELDGVESAPRYAVTPINPCVVRAPLQPEPRDEVTAQPVECPQCGARGPKDDWLCPRSTNPSARCARAGDAS